MRPIYPTRPLTEAREVCGFEGGALFVDECFDEPTLNALGIIARAHYLSTPDHLRRGIRLFYRIDTRRTSTVGVNAAIILDEKSMFASLASQT